MYQRDTYSDLVRHEVIAPAVMNNGEHSGYPHLFGRALAEAGFNWTSVHTTGCWNGKIEPGVQFTIFAPVVSPTADTHYFRTVVWGGDPIDDVGNGPITSAEHIGHIARGIMHDQDAIQIVVDSSVTLIEA